MDTVGIDLYLKILDDEIKRLKGEPIKEEEVKDEKPIINVTTHIDDKYTDEADLKIEIHKLISTIDSYDKLQEVKTEFEDRFGKIDKEIEIYMLEEWFEKLAKEIGIEKSIQTKDKIELIFNMDKSRTINKEELFMKSYKISKNFKFNYSNLRLSVILEFKGLEKHFIYYLIDLFK